MNQKGSQFNIKIWEEIKMTCLKCSFGDTHFINYVTWKLNPKPYSKKGEKTTLIIIYWSIKIKYNYIQDESNLSKIIVMIISIIIFFQSVSSSDITAIIDKHNTLRSNPKTTVKAMAMCKIVCYHFSKLLFLNVSNHGEVSTKVPFIGFEKSGDVAAHAIKSYWGVVLKNQFSFSLNLPSECWTK